MSLCRDVLLELLVLHEPSVARGLRWQSWEQFRGRIFQRAWRLCSQGIAETCGTWSPKSLCTFKNPALKGPICPHQQEEGPQRNLSVGHRQPIPSTGGSSWPSCIFKISCSAFLFQCEVSVYWVFLPVLKAAKKWESGSVFLLNFFRKEERGLCLPSSLAVLVYLSCCELNQSH